MTLYDLGDLTLAQVAIVLAVFLIMLIFSPLITALSHAIVNGTFNAIGRAWDFVMRRIKG